MTRPVGTTSSRPIDIAPGHPAIIVTRGDLPHDAASCWIDEAHTLVVSLTLNSDQIGALVARTLSSLGQRTPAA